MEVKLTLKEPKEKATWEYDKEADVLYISFGKPKPALSFDLGSGVIVRYSDGKIVDFTIVGLKKVLAKEA
jgi:uncharacterized protein YuzE